MQARSSAHLGLHEEMTMTARISNHAAASTLDRRHGSGWPAKLVKTSDDVGPVVARLALGAVMFPHGAQKALGWFGGPGLQATMGFMTGQLGIPALFAGLAIAAELFGSIGLLAGALSRVAAFGIGVTMLVALLMAHAGNGFFMNWSGAQPGEGFEYHLLAIGLALVVMLKGAGKWSVDRQIQTKLV